MLETDNGNGNGNPFHFPFIFFFELFQKENENEEFILMETKSNSPRALILFSTWHHDLPLFQFLFQGSKCTQNHVKKFYLAHVSWISSISIKYSLFFILQHDAGSLTFLSNIARFCCTRCCIFLDYFFFFFLSFCFSVWRKHM